MQYASTHKKQNASVHLQNPESIKIVSIFQGRWEQNATQQENPESPPPPRSKPKSTKLDGIYYQSLLSAVCDRRLTESLEILEGIGIQGELAIRCISFMNGVGAR